MSNSKDDVNVEEETVNIAIFNQTDAALEMLKEKYEKVPDTGVPGGFELVKAACSDLVSRRTSLEGARKKAKQPYLDGGRIIDKEAKRITAALVKLEEPMQAAKKLVDDREKREKEERLARLREKIAGIRAFVGKARGQESAEIAKRIEEVDAIDCSQDFYDLSVEAAEARTDTLTQLNEIYSERLQFEISEKERKELEERQKEDERKRLIENKLNDLKSLPLDFVGKTSKEIGEKLDALSGWTPSPEVFGHLHDEAVEALNSVIGKLEQLKDGAEHGEKARADQEAEADRLQQIADDPREPAETKELEAVTDVAHEPLSGLPGRDQPHYIEPQSDEPTVAEIITGFFAGFKEFDAHQAWAIAEAIMGDAVPGVTITVTKEK